jgi:hypothetical protein
VAELLRTDPDLQRQTSIGSRRVPDSYIREYEIVQSKATPKKIRSPKSKQIVKDNYQNPKPRPLLFRILLNERELAMMSLFQSSGEQYA